MLLKIQRRNRHVSKPAVRDPAQAGRPEPGQALRPGTARAESGCGCGNAQLEPFGLAVDPAPVVGQSPQVRTTPPAEGRRTVTKLAIGDLEAWRVGSIVYVRPDDGYADPLFPCGYYSKRWGLRVDNVQHGKGRIVQVASGVGFDLKWRNNCPRLYEKEIDEFQSATHVVMCWTLWFATPRTSECSAAPPARRPAA